MTERIKRQLEKIEALMAPPEILKPNIKIIYVDPVLDPVTGSPTGKVVRYPPGKDETKR